MARFHIAAALGAAIFALLVLFQLISNFGLPELTFLNLHPKGEYRRPSPLQIPIDLAVPGQENGKEDESLYLLGVGKGDITGYAGFNRQTAETNIFIDPLSRST